MCEKQYVRFADRGHYGGDYIRRCAATLARAEYVTCVPPSGSTRDLPHATDVQDMNTPGKCQQCGHKSFKAIPRVGIALIGSRRLTVVP
jgi:hypothetical protein